MPIEIRPTAVICSIRLVRFSAERKRSFWDWKMIQITARPSTTRSDARSPWTNLRRAVLVVSIPPLTVSALLATALLPRLVGVVLFLLADTGYRRDDMLLRGPLGIEAAR